MVRKGNTLKIYKILLHSLITSSLLVSISSANASQNSINQQDIQEQNSLSQPIVPTASEKIDDWADAFLQKVGIPSFGEVNGKFFYYAQEAVSIPATDPQFGNALVNAYDKAFFAIMEQYAKDMYGRETVDEIRHFFSDSSTNAAKIELPNNYTRGFWGKILTILDKNLDVIDKTLDKKLIGLGVDPKELQHMSPKQKKDLFKDKFIKNVITKASGDVSGIFTIQSAWASDKNGNYVVGVIAVVSPKTKQIAKDIKYHRKSLIKGKGRDIRSLIPDSPQDLSKTLGTRLVYDIDGTPAIISYGIQSYIPNKDHYINVRLKQNAKEGAISNADAQIAMLVNGYLSTKTSRQTGEEIRKYVERELKPDSDTIEKTIKNIIDITNKQAQAHASMNLQGVSTVKTWRYTLPTGQKLVGAVRVWRYATLQKINQFKKGYKQTSKHTTNKSGKSGFGESQIVNDINDF